MQTITVKTVQEKTSRNDPTKKFWIVTDESGADLSTFDASAGQILPGAVIEAEITVKGKYKNLEKWTVMKQGTAEPPPPATERPKDDKPWSYIQTAVNFGLALRQNVDMDDNEQRIYEAALSWVADQLGVIIFKEPQKTAAKAPTPTQQTGSTTKPPASDAPGATEGNEQGKLTLKTPGDLWQWAQSKGLTIEDIRRITGHLGPTSTKDMAGDYAKVVAELKKRHEAKQEVKS